MLSAMLVEIEFAATIGRVRNLVDLYGKVAGPGRGRKPVNTSDILRSAVVLLHATFEQAMRELARRRLPSAPARTLDQIPLAGISQVGRPEKFFLGALAAYRGKRVDDVIWDSIAEYLAHLTINNTPDLVNLLRSVEIRTDSIQDDLPVLAEMFSRRHNIVHRADALEKRGSGHHQAKSLNQGTVSTWIDTVDQVVHKIAHEVAFPAVSP